MLTGVIYGAIVVVWAAYLVPLALRRHDQASRTRSIERFSSAMRVLARRGTSSSPTLSSGSRVVVTPRRDEPRVVTPEPAPEPERVLVTPRLNRSAERAAAARRRRVLTILLGLTVVVSVVSVLGVAPRWAVVPPLMLVLGFLVVARRSVRRASAPYWVEAAAPESATVVVRRSAVRVDTSRDDFTPDPSDEPDDDEPTITLTAAQRKLAASNLSEDRVVAVSVQSSGAESLWDPLPVTLPTYVDAPVARRSFRTIELGELGTWTSGHSAADSQTVAASATVTVSEPAAAADVDSADDDSDDEVARAVNS